MRRLANNPIDKLMPSVCVAYGQSGWGHGGHDEEESPEISRMDTAAGEKVVEGPREQKGENHEPYSGGPKADRWRTGDGGR